LKVESSFHFDFSLLASDPVNNNTKQQLTDDESGQRLAVGLALETA
jgi:hypothetical protein